MVFIKKRSIRAYILLESLIALSLLVVITGLLLSNLTQAQKQIRQANQHIETLNVAQMALETGQASLAINDVSVRIQRDDHHVAIFNQDKKESELEILQIEK